MKVLAIAVEDLRARRFIPSIRRHSGWCGITPQLFAAFDRIRHSGNPVGRMEYARPGYSASSTITVPRFAIECFNECGTFPLLPASNKKAAEWRQVNHLDWRGRRGSNPRPPA